MNPTLTIDAYFDLICPWCMIGKRHLAAAVTELATLRPDVEPRVAWHPVMLMPETPVSGVPFQAFYEGRLGGAAAVVARQAQVRGAGRSAGIDFAFERIAVFPNTLAAHRLVQHAARQGGSRKAEAVIDATLSAYFTRGENIGDAIVLARLAARCGLDPLAVSAHLDSSEGAALLDQQQEQARRRGISGVPCFVFNDRLAVSGAHPPSALLDVMQRALGA